MAVTCALVLGGCGVAADGPIPGSGGARLQAALDRAGDASSPRRVDEASVSGEVEFMTGASPVESRILRRLVRTFEKSHPNITVSFTAVNRDYPTVVLTRFAGGAPPDVFVVDGKFFNDWAAKGLLLPLDGYLAGAGQDLSKVHATLASAVRGPGGRTYALPQNYSTVALWVNDDMLKRHGVTSVPTTWQQLEAAARATTADGAVGLCLIPNWERMTVFALQQNGGLVSPDGRRMTVLSPETRRSVEWIVRMLRSGAAATPDFVGSQWCGDAFGKRKVAMVLEGAWMLPPMRQFPDVRWSVHPLPAGVRRATLAYAGTLAISSTSSSPDASWLLLRYLTSPAAQRQLADARLAVPATIAVPYPPELRPFAEGIDYATVWAMPPGFFNSVLVTADNEMSAVLEGKQSINGMLGEVDGIGNRMLGVTKP